MQSKNRIFIKKNIMRHFSSLKCLSPGEQRLDVLINNAAVAVLQKYELTVDGHEMTWQCNHLGKLNSK
jgi:hypothetical protein